MDTANSNNGDRAVYWQTVVDEQKNSGLSIPRFVKSEESFFPSFITGAAGWCQWRVHYPGWVLDKAPLL